MVKESSAHKEDRGMVVSFNFFFAIFHSWSFIWFFFLQEEKHQTYRYLKAASQNIILGHFSASVILLF